MPNGRKLDEGSGARSPEVVADDRPLSRRSEIDSFMVMDVMQQASVLEDQGRHIVHMEVGQPGTPAPATARQRLKTALAEQSLGYTVALGLPELRERIARHYADTYGVEIEPARVIITSGSSAGFLLAFLTLFDAGESVALPNPGYPCYRQILKSLDLTPCLIATSDATRWMPTAAAVSDAHNEAALSGLIVASPANPTGTMITPERLGELAEVCERLGLWLISDEIYHGLTFEASATTALSVCDNAIVINSFSKYFSMTGWRVGWMVVPDRLVRPLEKLNQNLFICAPAISQVAALGAFDGLEELEKNKAVYARNRQCLLDVLPRCGFDRILPADGAFYLYCDISSFGIPSSELAQEILNLAGVAVTPGIDFDPVNGHRYIRFSYARSQADISDAAARLQRWSESRP